ncbi:hypothetical protein [Virgibacillus siamensis]|uniref:hypothetical protein n=1 Tax=Virgibacillus siamensis TaxID=480071 RepID=UPI000987D32E|nr:hypothetical protein [Virgibacillus siamensis]
MIDYTKASDNQLINIFLYDKTCPVDYFAGLVKEINSRQLVDVYATMELRYRKMAQMKDKYYHKYDYLRRSKQNKEVIEQLELHNTRLQAEVNTLRRKLRRAGIGTNHQRTNTS